MDAQNLVKQRLSMPEALQRVSGLLSAEPQLSRAELSRRVCGEFSFYDACDRPQTSSCSAALQALAADGQIVLPEPRASGGCRVRRGSDPIPPALNVPERADLVEGLRLLPVQSPVQSAIWNELMVTEHPLGKAALVGYQCRYLVGSAHGWLGGVGFAASALRLAPRDRWIGWDDKTRAQRLHRVVGLSRFLIRPGIDCRNLASRLLGLSLRTMVRDFDERYGFYPWLVETFIDPAHHSGASLRASNWVHVGETRGRGRHDRHGLADEPVKEIYMYELEPGCRAALSARPVVPVPVGEGLSRESWAEYEFGNAPLGDKRLARRLVDSAHVQAEAPRSPFSVAAGGNMAAVTGFYRLPSARRTWGGHAEKHPGAAQGTHAWANADPEYGFVPSGRH